MKKSKPNPKANRNILWFVYAAIFLFLAMGIYVGYFLVVKSDTVRVDFSMTALDYLRSKARNVNLGHKDSTRKWDPYITVTLADGAQYPYRGLVDFADPHGYLLRAGRDAQSRPYPAPRTVH